MAIRENTFDYTLKTEATEDPTGEADVTRTFVETLDQYTVIATFICREGRFLIDIVILERGKTIYKIINSHKSSFSFAPITINGKRIKTDFSVLKEGEKYFCKISLEIDE